MRHSKSRTENGFALLITLVVVSIVLAIGLSLLFVTTKQYLLAITANESEKAFQASQIGIECLRYHRNAPATLAKFLAGDSNTPLNCAGVVSNVINSGGQPVLVLSGGNYWLYNYRYSYTIDNQCAEPSIYIADFRQYSGADLELSITGEGLETIECAAGTICTAIFSRGYNRPCGQLDSIYTIQREITIEY